MNCVIEESSLLNVFIALEGGVLGRGEQGVEMLDSIFWYHTNFVQLLSFASSLRLPGTFLLVLQVSMKWVMAEELD